jgi:hypothetical protein
MHCAHWKVAAALLTVIDAVTLLGKTSNAPPLLQRY